MGAVVPRVTADPGSYSVTWEHPEAAIHFLADRLRSHSDGRVQSRVRVVAELAGSDPLTLSHGNLNLAAGRSRRELSRDLENRLQREGVNWDQIIEESCRLILEHEEQGAPVEHLQPVENTQVDYLVRPLLLEHLPVVWYAPGASGKSMLAMYVALLVQNGLPFFQEPVTQQNVLYLDWEVTREEAARRCTLLANGLGQTHIGASLQFPLYRRCTGSIQDEASEIAKNIANHRVGLVFVDSAGAACGGDVMSGELAVHLFNTLRRVTASTNATVCMLTHTTKADRREENQRRLPIGSIYFENMARATWEMRADDADDSRALRVGVFPRKQNLSRCEPVGLKFLFERDAVVVEAATVGDVSTEAGTTQATIIDELEKGPASIKELTDAVGAKPDTIRKALQRLKDRGSVVSTERGIYRRSEVTP